MQLKHLLRQEWEMGPGPYTRTFLMWMVCAGIAGLACGAVGAVFFHLVSWATGMRQANPWLLSDIAAPPFRLLKYDGESCA